MLGAGFRPLNRGGGGLEVGVGFTGVGVKMRRINAGEGGGCWKRQEMCNFFIV